MESQDIDAVWTIDDPKTGLVALQSLLVEHPESADEIRTQIARALGLLGKFNDAWEELEYVSGNEDSIVLTRLELERGRLQNSSGNREQAIPHFRTALRIAQEAGLDFFAVDAAHMLGIVSDGFEAVEWNQLALEMSGKSPDSRTQKWRGSLLNNLGWAYYHLHEHDAALKTFEMALEWQVQNGSAVNQRIAQWTIARCLRALNRNQEAILVLQPLTLFPEAGFVSEEMGENLLALGKLDQAQPHFQRALDLFSKNPLFQNEQNDRLARIAAFALGDG